VDEVRRLRLEKGWSQNELAYHAKLAPSVISLIETGKRDPNATTLRKLAGALEVRIPDLFEESGSGKAQRRSSLEPSLLNGLEDERRYRPTTQDAQALERYLSRLQRELDEDRMHRPDIERELDVVRAFGPAVCASMGDETADLILVLGRRLLEKAKEMKVRVDVEAEAGVTRLEEWREREAS